MRQLRKFLLQAQHELCLRPDSLAVCLVSEAKIERWNRVYRGKEGPTDVLSFPAEAKAKNANGHGRPEIHIGRRDHKGPGDSGDAHYLGDIAIAPAVAKRNARRFGRTFDDEMRILILHGVLHLLGYDHEADTGQMDRRERRLRRALGLA